METLKMVVAILTLVCVYVVPFVVIVGIGYLVFKRIFTGR